MRTGLIGLGAIGVPIAHRLYKQNVHDFYLISDQIHKEKLLKHQIYINDEPFSAKILSEADCSDITLDLLIVCVKNYAIKTSLKDILPFVGKDTIVLPLQNGIFAYRFFKDTFPENTVLQGYVQGPNTEKVHNGFSYQNPGVLHIGSEEDPEKASQIVKYLHSAGCPVFFEENIKKMVWKKWMLNVAGNSVTALTGADYSLFKLYSNLQKICKNAMEEFVLIANAEGVQLSEVDINDVIGYYVSYVGSKKTSMLMDVLLEKGTENEYLAGSAIELALHHGIKVPVISTLYYLMDIKEKVYMGKKGVHTMKKLFSDGVEYSDALRVQMNDVNKKMSDPDYANQIQSGAMPERLLYLLQYAADNTKFYSQYKGKNLISDFPVVNKTFLNANYDAIVVHAYDNVKTHKMHTSGSTGIPFTVVQNLAKRERHIADLKYYGALAGYSDHDPMCYLRAKPTATPAQQERDNIWQLDICNLSTENLTEYFQIMVEKKCTALIAYPSTLETAVDFWKKNFTNLSSIKTIISTSETLTDTVRAKLKDFFGDDVEIHARYSNTEQGILGQEVDTNGEYQLNWASYYFEVLEMDSDIPAKDGELGRVVVTDLYNEAFPMIRYDTGDVARMQKGDGNSLPYFSELYGRRMDLIYDVNGEVVSPFLLCRTMRLSSGIDQWQFIQENKNTYTLKVTSASGQHPNVENEVAGFKQTLGEGSTINVEYVEEIPVLNSLKRKLIVSKLVK